MHILFVTAPCKPLSRKATNYLVRLTFLSFSLWFSTKTLQSPFLRKEATLEDSIICKRTLVSWTKYHKKSINWHYMAG